MNLLEFDFKKSAKIKNAQNLKGIVMVTICRCLRRESILFCFSLNFTVSKVGNNIGKDETVAII